MTAPASTTREGGIVLRHVPERSRYEVVDGEDVVGHADYREPDATHRDFVHTEVDEAYGGRGLAGALVELALDDTRAAGRRIVPHCPYVAGWIRKHPGRFDDLTDWPA